MMDGISPHHYDAYRRSSASWNETIPSARKEVRPLEEVNGDEAADSSTDHHMPSSSSSSSTGGGTRASLSASDAQGEVAPRQMGLSRSRRKTASSDRASGSSRVSRLGSSAGTRAGKKKKKKRCISFGLYIYKVLKSIHTETGIGKMSMAIMNSFINDTLDRLCTEALKLLVISKKKTLTKHEMKAAAKLLIPGELFKHAYEEANDAVNKFEAVRDALKNFPSGVAPRLM